jgi:NDP-sugar pyrophosphorylase family protein
VFEPDVLSIIPENSCCDMMGFFKKNMAQYFKTTAFPLREYWRDVGHIDDLERSKLEYFEMLG